MGTGYHRVSVCTALGDVPVYRIGMSIMPDVGIPSRVSLVNWSIEHFISINGTMMGIVIFSVIVPRLLGGIREILRPIPRWVIPGIPCSGRPIEVPVS